MATDGLAGDEQCGQAGDKPEHAEGDGFGPDGPLGLGLGDRRDVEVERASTPIAVKEARRLGLHLGHAPAAAAYLHGGVGGLGATVEKRPGERRGEEGIE